MSSSFSQAQDELPSEFTDTPSIAEDVVGDRLDLKLKAMQGKEKIKSKVRKNKYKDKYDPDVEVESVAVVLVDMFNGSAAMTREIVEQRMWGETDSVRDIISRNTQGKLVLEADLDNDGQYDTFGPYLVEQPVNTACSGLRFNWTRQVKEIALLDGRNLDDYDHAIYVIPANTSCKWWGVSGLQPGPLWVKDDNTFTLAHELAHNFSLRHSGLDADNDNVIEIRQEDASSLLGYHRQTGVFLNAPLVEELGFIYQSEGAVWELDESYGTHEITIAPLSIDPSTTTYPQIVTFWKKSTNLKYFLSFRNDFLYDANILDQYKTGVSIHWASRIGDPSTPEQTALVKTLSDGEVFSDAEKGVKIEQIYKYADDLAVDIRVTFEEPSGVRPISIVSKDFKSPYNYVHPNEIAKYWVRLKNNDLETEEPTAFTLTLVDSAEWPQYPLLPNTTYQFSSNPIILAPGEEEIVQLDVYQNSVEETYYVFNVAATEYNPTGPIPLEHQKLSAYEFFYLSYADPLPVTDEGPSDPPEFPFDASSYYDREKIPPPTDVEANIMWENNQPVEVIFTFDGPLGYDESDLWCGLYADEFPVADFLINVGYFPTVSLDTEYLEYYYPDWYENNETHWFSIGCADRDYGGGSGWTALSEPIGVTLSKIKKTKKK